MFKYVYEHQQLFTVSPANYSLLGQCIRLQFLQLFHSPYMWRIHTCIRGWSMELIDHLKLGCWALMSHQHETALVSPSILQYALPLERKPPNFWGSSYLIIFLYIVLWGENIQMFAYTYLATPVIPYDDIFNQTWCLSLWAQCSQLHLTMKHEMHGLLLVLQCRVGLRNVSEERVRVACEGDLTHGCSVSCHYVTCVTCCCVL